VRAAADEVRTLREQAAALRLFAIAKRCEELGDEIERGLIEL
jgi:hypothetical protein